MRALWRVSTGSTPTASRHAVAGRVDAATATSNAGAFQPAASPWRASSASAAWRTCAASGSAGACARAPQASASSGAASAHRGIGMLYLIEKSKSHSTVSQHTTRGNHEH
jgi:hypothetical protein